MHKKCQADKYTYGYIFVIIPFFQISKELISFYDSVYDRGVSLTDTEQKQAAATVLKVFHETVSSPDVLRNTQLIKLTQTPLKPKNISTYF